MKETLYKKTRETVKEMNTDTINSIILLTDFSDPAKNAIKFAVDAFGEDVEYNLVNAYYARTSSATLLDLNDMLAKESEQGLTEEHEWMDKTYPNLNLNVKTHSVFGSPIDALKKMKRQKERDVVVMGTKGSSGVDAVLFGSVASAVIRATIIPVISVPPTSQFEGFKEIVFATDGEQIYSNETLEPINKLQKRFNSNVDVFAVERDGKKLDLAGLNLNIENAHYSTAEGDDIADVITEFCNEKKADLLVILPKHTGFFDRLFHHSISKELVEKAQMPILALDND